MLDRLKFPLKVDLILLIAGTVLAAVGWWGLFGGGEEETNRLAMVIGGAFFVIQGIIIYYTWRGGSEREVSDFHVWNALFLLVLMISTRQVSHGEAGRPLFLVVCGLGALAVLVGGLSYHFKQQDEIQPLFERYRAAKEIFARKAEIEEEQELTNTPAPTEETRSDEDTATP